MSWYTFIKYEIKRNLVMLSMKWNTWLVWLVVDWYDTWM